MLNALDQVRDVNLLTVNIMLYPWIENPLCGIVQRGFLAAEILDLPPNYRKGMKEARKFITIFAVPGIAPGGTGKV